MRCRQVSRWADEAVTFTWPNAMEDMLVLLFEFAWTGPGCLILRLLGRKPNTEPDGCLVFLVSTAFWAVVALAIWALVVLLSR